MTSLRSRAVLLAVGAVLLAGCDPSGGTAAASRHHDEGGKSDSAATVAAAGKDVPASDPVICPSRTVMVPDAASLTAALAAAKPGSVIGLADGTYSGHFTMATAGRADSPIWLCGGPSAVLDGGGIEAGYVLHLDSASFVRVVGFTIRNGQKGVVVDASSHVYIQGLTVTGIGDEAIHLRRTTTDSVVLGNSVSRTGRLSPKFGEGIYVGTAKSNWCTYSNCQPDPSDRNVVRGNNISATTSESVDVKEGTTGGAILDNTFDGTAGLTGADSWVDVKGNNWLVRGNTGQHSPNDGFQVHKILDGWGTGNVFVANSADVQGPGYGIDAAPAQNTVVTCDNKVTAAAKGLSNVTCT